jgi:RNA exonuclease 1
MGLDVTTFYLHCLAWRGADKMMIGTTPKDAQPTPVLPTPLSRTALTPILTSLNTHLTRLHASLPPRTALIIFTGHSDPRQMSYLNSRKTAFEAALKSGKTLEDIGKEGWWTSSNGRELEDEVERAKRGLVFLSITG